jgi:tetraacyldisaccharide 4'-kinase
VAGARTAVAAGADVLVLDDAFQRLDVARDLNIALVSAESARRPRWTLPAGPWRESWQALTRADVIVVTRKRATAADAGTIADRLATARPGVPVVVAHLDLGRLEGLRAGASVPLDALRGRSVAVAAGVADPTTVAVQVRQRGAAVRLLAYPDHHAYGPADVRRLVQAATDADYLIVTEKDAVKLRHQWPGNAREPLVAVLTVDWGAHTAPIGQLLDGVLALPARPPTTDES